ncbi:mCG147997 [Mus musculus]|nr:mCG147997 [Mus musculus]
MSGPVVASRTMASKKPTVNSPVFSLLDVTWSPQERLGLEPSEQAATGT